MAGLQLLIWPQHQTDWIPKRDTQWCLLNAFNVFNVMEGIKEIIRKVFILSKLGNSIVELSRIRRL